VAVLCRLVSDDRDPEATLREWKESMQAEHADAIANPDPDADHAVEAVVQPSERIRFAYEDGELVEQDRERIEADEPELFACACGVRGMTREEAREHLAAVGN
jgi:hypothetical protein